MKRIVVIGHAAIDHTYRIDAFPPAPTKVRAREHLVGGGGMAANASATIGRLGGSVELWSRTGDDDRGDKIRAFLKDDGVDVEFVRSLPGARTSSSAVIVDAHGERLVIGDRDHEMSFDASWLPLERISGAGAVLSDLRWFEASLAGLTRARKEGVPTVIDGDFDSPHLLERILAVTDYAIFPAGALAHLYPDERDDAARLERVLSQGPSHAGVTSGAGGYHWLSRSGGPGHQPAFPVDVVDTTGAGDAFHGGFTWGLVHGLDEAGCARIAAATAAIKCRELGARAGLPTHAELEEFLAASRAPAA